MTSQRSYSGDAAKYVFVRLTRPEGYEDVHPELVLDDANINPAFEAEIVTSDTSITHAARAEPVAWIAVTDRLPEDGVQVLTLRPSEDWMWDDNERYGMDMRDEGVWVAHNNDREHFEAVGGAGAAGPGEVCAGPSEDAPYTHWAPLLPLPDTDALQPPSPLFTHAYAEGRADEKEGLVSASVLVPREPDDALLRPFYECPPEELRLAWNAMLYIAARRSTATQVASPSPAREEAGKDALDAARYRWLREQPDNTDAPRIDVVHWTVADEASNAGEGLRMDALDAAIDAALAADQINKEKQ
jgi:hypothetical protein